MLRHEQIELNQPAAARPDVGDASLVRVLAVETVGPLANVTIALPNRDGPPGPESIVLRMAARSLPSVDARLWLRVVGYAHVLLR